ncbi:MAG TPA: tetratricopeptide repeat protein [Candidatus Sulfotelmatobacter sp.]|nr:tetratricopeptide repeat protein [Candidatus Sulfotelmatobacter sp.]
MHTPLGHRGWMFILFLFAATLMVYLPAWRPAAANAPAIEKPGFIWDDGGLCVENRLIKVPHGWYEFWATKITPDYFPVMSDAFWLEWRMWGMNPAGYRLVNILLHVLNAVLLWRILRQLMPPPDTAARIAAVLFALHPVNVASVAWIAELKNTLSFFFFALALLAYLKFDDGRSRRWYWFSFAAFLLSLLSKIEAAPLPLILLGVVWWRRNRIDPKDIRRTIPFFAAAFILGLTSIWFQTHVAIAHDVVRTDNFWSRLAGAGRAVWFYFYKDVWPASLIPVYPLWHIDAADALSYLPGILLIVSFSIFWIYRRGWGRRFLFGLGYAVLMLLPVLGFVNIYFFRYSLVADHWQYFAIVGPIALVSAALVKLVDSLTKNEILKWLSCFGFFALVGILTWNQAGVYRNWETLCTATLAKNPDCFVAHNELGLILLSRGDTDNAISEFKKTIQLDPQYETAYNNLGIAYLQTDNLDEASKQFQTALLIRPNYAQAHYNLGSALLKRGKTDEAILHFQKALQLDPDEGEIEDNLGDALFRYGAKDEAMLHFQKALQLKPNAADAHNNLGNALLQKGNVDEAIAEFQKSLQLDPDNAPAFYDIGNALWQKGNVDEAITDYQKALNIQSNYPDAENNLGSALLQKNEVAGAMLHFQKALQLNPGDAQIHNNLGSALLQTGNVDEAIKQFQTAVQLDPNYARAHYNLGNALLQKADPREAIVQYGQALQSNPEDAQTLNNLALVLATCRQDSLRDGSKAVELAQRADQLTHSGNPYILGTLAAADAEAGRFPEAVAAAQHAIQLAGDQSNAALVEVIQSQLKLYQAGVPYHDSAPQP